MKTNSFKFLTVTLLALITLNGWATDNKISRKNVSRGVCGMAAPTKLWCPAINNLTQKFSCLDYLKKSDQDLGFALFSKAYVCVESAAPRFSSATLNSQEFTAFVRLAVQANIYTTEPSFSDVLADVIARSQDAEKIFKANVPRTCFGNELSRVVFNRVHEIKADGRPVEMMTEDIESCLRRSPPIKSCSH